MKRFLLMLFLVLGLSLRASAQSSTTLTASATTCAFTSAGCLVNSISQAYGGATFTVTANASGNTIQFEASGDGGTTWVALNVTPSNSTTAATSTTSTGTWQANIAAYTHIRMRMSTLVGGTTTVQINLSNASARSGGGGGGGGVTSFSGDGTIITNAASTGAVTTTIAGTSGGIPCFNSASTWTSSAAIGAGVLVKGGGAGACAGTSSLTDNGTAIVGTEPIRLAAGAQGAPSYSFSASTTDGWYERSPNIMDMSLGSFTPSEFFTGGIRQGSNGVFGFTNTANSAALSFDTGMSRGAAGLTDFGTGGSGSTVGFVKSAQTLQVTAADVTCGTSGTLTPCTAFTTITGLTATLPLVAANWSYDCDLVVGQATAAAANQIGLQTATNAPTNSEGSGIVYTAAGVSTAAAFTGASSTTVQSIVTFTPGATGTKLPIHIAGTIEGTSVSGTVFNLQVLTGSGADLLTIYRGSNCWIF